MRDTRPRTKSDMNILNSVSRMMYIGHSIKNYADSGDYVIIENSRSESRSFTWVDSTLYIPVLQEIAFASRQMIV